MREFSEKYKELALRAGRYPKLRMEVYAGTRGEWTDTVEAEYSGENAIISAIYTNGVITKPSRFETGLAFCGSLEMELSGDTYATLSTGKRFKLYAGFYDPEEGDIVETAMGEFFVESVSADKGKTTLKARDKMMFAEQKFNATGMTYPCSLLDCLREIFGQMGFTMPENYTLDINPTIRAPAWQKPNMTEGVYNNGYFYVEDPEGYSITMPGGDKPTKGHVYSATGYALTCREALGSIAKMQLGNCYIDGDGIPRFSSYKISSPLSDDRVTGLSVGDDDFTIKGISENYLGYDLESVNLYKRATTEWRGDLMYYTNFPSDLPESYDPIKTRAIGKTFYEGMVERKGLGETEIGDFIDYSGKLGTRRFFVFGLQYEWSGASFDETLYSFAPDYKGVDYEWLNDRDLIADEEKQSEPFEEEKPGIIETPEIGLTIDKAVIVKQADAKYLLHSFTEIEYIAANRIGYAGPGNQIVVQGYLAYFNTTLGGNVYGSTYQYTEEQYEASLADKSRYFGMPEFKFYSKYYSEHYTGLRFEIQEATATRTTYIIFGIKETGEDQNIGGFSNYLNWSGAGLLLSWDTIYPPGYTDTSAGSFEFGCIKGNLHTITKGSGTNPSQAYLRTPFYRETLYVPFASLAEYQAAVGLTYEPLTLTRVEDNPTIVSGKDIGEEVT